MSLLAVSNISKDFGGIQALTDVSFKVPEGCIFGIIGPNGAGKTTLFNIITGATIPSWGTVLFRGMEITGLPSFKIARAGVSRTFQIIRLFPYLSVLENILVAQNKDNPSGLISIFRSSRSRRERELMQQALEVVEFVGLMGFQNKLATELSYGQQRRLELGRAVATQPRLLLLDEFASGLTHQETIEVVDRVRSISKQGCTIIIIEHDMDVIMNVCNIVAVLNFGCKIMEGSPDEVQNDPGVLEAYLGREC